MPVLQSGPTPKAWYWKCHLCGDSRGYFNSRQKAEQDLDYHNKKECEMQFSEDK